MQDKEFQEFCLKVKGRLVKGREEYGDKSFAKTGVELLDEIEEELLDVMGWGFILHARIHRLKVLLGTLPTDKS